MTEPVRFPGVPTKRTSERAIKKDGFSGFRRASKEKERLRRHIGFGLRRKLSKSGYNVLQNSAGGKLRAAKDANQGWRAAGLIQSGLRPSKQTKVRQHSKQRMLTKLISYNVFSTSVRLSLTIRDWAIQGNGNIFYVKRSGSGSETYSRMLDAVRVQLALYLNPSLLAGRVRDGVEARGLLDEGAEELGLQLGHVQAELERVGRQHHVVVDAGRLHHHRGEQLERLERMLKIGIANRNENSKKLN